jgi:hypothetical protein
MSEQLKDDLFNAVKRTLLKHQQPVQKTRREWTNPFVSLGFASFWALCIYLYGIR